jgi:hypothetical protein
MPRVTISETGPVCFVMRHDKVRKTSPSTTSPALWADSTDMETPEICSSPCDNSMTQTSEWKYSNEGRLMLLMTCVLVSHWLQHAREPLVLNACVAVAGPRQHSDSCFRVLRDSRPYFNIWRLWEHSDPTNEQSLNLERLFITWRPSYPSISLHTVNVNFIQSAGGTEAVSRNPRYLQSPVHVSLGWTWLMFSGIRNNQNWCNSI